MIYIENFYNWLKQSLGDKAISTMFFIFVDVLVLLFCVSVILFFVNNYASAYRACAKEVMLVIKNGGDEAAINAEMRKMPYITKSLWHRFRKERKGKPSDYLTVSSCLAIPVKTSWMNIFSKILQLLSFVFGVFIYSFDSEKGLKVAAMLIVIGFSLAVILIIFEKLSYNATYHMHEKLMQFLNDKSKEFAMFAGVVKPVSQEIMPQVSDPEFTQQIYETPQNIQQQVYSTLQNVPQQVFEVPAQPIRKPQQQYQQKQLIPTSTPAQQGYNNLNQVRNSTVNRPQPTRVFDIETQNLLMKIDSAIRSLSSSATLRQLAAALQRAKVKPENQTPDRQQRLNRAMSALLKAISESNR